MSTNLKIFLACVTTLVSGLAINTVINDYKDTKALIKRGEAQKEAMKEIEKMYAEDKKTFENIKKTEKTQKEIEELLKELEP